MATTRSKGRRFISSLILLANTGAIIGLLLSYAAGYVAPDRFWPLAFFGLTFLWWVGFNILFVLWWVFQGRIYFLLSSLCLLGGYQSISRHFQGPTTVINTPDNNHFDIMTFNVRNFDLYNWMHNKDGQTREKILQLINAESPDIICFQEFYSKKNSDYDIISKIKKINPDYNFVTSHLNHRKKGELWGVATASRFPVVNSGRIDYGKHSGNYAVFTDLVIQQGDTIRLFNVHFESIRLGKDDLLFISDFGNGNSSEKLKTGSRKILSKLKKAFIYRAPQVRVLNEQIRQSPYPVLLSGDFNDTPTSYVYNELSNLLEDTFMDAGEGFGNTWNGLFPDYRIDYIFHDSAFSTISLKVIKGNRLSDHYPISARLSFN